ncbi:MAG TPA: MFS transporter [Anaeromyxobacteraceae bacterium]|nr:MFS transporter [Anaeromyxobacteraceae bacterium]
MPPLPPAPAVEPAAAPPRAALFALGLAGFCAFLGVYATQPILPELERVFGASKAAAALTVSAATIAVALASPFVGFAVRRFGHRRVTVACLLVLPVPTLLAATATGIPSLVAWRFLQGLVVPGIYAVTMAFIADRWPAHDLGRAMSYLVTGNVIGGFSGRVLSGLADDRFGWRASFLVLGAVTAVAAAVASRLLPREAGAPSKASPAALAPARAILRDVVREPRLLATFAVGFNVLFSHVATFTYVTFHLSGPPYLLGTGTLAWLFSVYLVGAVITPFAGRWIDRVGSRRALTAALAAALAGGALSLVPSVAAVVAGLAATSTAVFVSQSASTAYLRTAAPARARSVASGLYVSIYYLGGAAGGVAPALAWHLGGWPACVGLVAAVQLVTIALAARFWRERAPRPVAAPPAIGEAA